MAFSAMLPVSGMQPRPLFDRGDCRTRVVEAGTGASAEWIDEAETHHHPTILQIFGRQFLVFSRTGEAF